MPEFTTPLENLFLYIRDIFGNPTTCTDFEKERNNEKAKDINYWDIGSVYEIARKTKQQNITEFEFVLTSDIEVFGSTLLTIKKISVPLPPTPPTEIQDWVEINNTLNSFPTISFKKEIEQRQNFENSQQRINTFKKYKDESQNPLFPITVPEILEGWITTENNQLEIISERVMKIKFEEDMNRVSKYKRFETEFNDYHKRYEIPIRINKIYDGLHKLHYDIKGRDNIKLYFSFGLISGKIGKNNYRNFTFHIPLKMTLKSHQLKIEFDTFSSKIFAEQNFAGLLYEHFSGESANSIESKKNEVITAIENFNAQQQQFIFDRDFIRGTFYNNALEILNIFPAKENDFLKGEELNFEYDKSTTPNIRFSFSPIIQTKLTESKIDVANDAQNIARKIFELKQKGLIDLIPDFFKKLFGTEDINPDSISNGGTNPRPENEGINTNALITLQYLFPLPFNDEQFEIARRLQEQDAVTVKGPPGTGKSHTIANLVSHFVAQGKSILVVSQNSKALSVIKDKLPKGIQNLSISLVNEGQGSETLKTSVNAIITNISKEHNENKIKEISKEQENLEKKYSDTLQKIYNLIQANSKLFKTFNPFKNEIESKTATEWAEYYFQNKFDENYFIIDKVEFAVNKENFSKEILELIKTGEKLSGSDFELHKYNFIEREEFVSLTELRKIEDSLNTILSQINLHQFEKVNYQLIDETFLTELEKFNAQYNKLKEKRTAFHLLKNSNFQVSELKEIINGNQELIEQIENAERILLNYNIDITPIANGNPFELHIQINQLILKFGENNSLNFFQKKLLNKQLNSFLECTVNYSKATNIEQIKIIETEIQKRKSLEQLKITFGNYFQKNQLGSIENILENISNLKYAIEFDRTLKLFNERLLEINYSVLNVHSNSYEEQLSYLNKIFLYAQYKELHEELNQKVKQITTHPKQHPLIRKIADAILDVDRTSYERNCNNYFVEKEKSITANQYNNLLDSLLSHLPETANILNRRLRGKEKVNVTQLKLEQDLFLQQLNNFLETSLSKNNSSEKLFDDLQTIKKNLERNTEELIVAKTWFEKSKRVTDNELSSLNAWLNDLTRMGKGFGRNYARDKAASISNMQSAKRAVPIWIMQLESAITFFPDPAPNQFDVLIIDEASQCDISSLNLIFRAKKALIVGDENQTSVVVDKNISIDRVNELLDKYFLHHQFKTQFDVTSRTSSVYSMSSVVYPNIVSLKEHFRCLPEIIGYSNQYIYANSIIPLKTATELLYGEPTEIQYVEDDISDTKKSKIVEQVLERILQFIQDFKSGRITKLPTVGVIALESSNVNHLTELNKIIAGNEIVKQYEDDLDFKVGTSREFQGDERDIIFLTISATHTFDTVRGSDNIIIKPPVAATTEEFMRIYNVAASRAREKCILFHSIHPDAIPLMNNPNCYRKKLINYYTNPNAPQTSSNQLQDLLIRCDANSGEFEKGVCTLLYNNNFGNYITPQYKIGGYKIDFGIVKDNKKIAIECDGYLSHSGFEQIRNDIKRQEILERVGWKFFRIQSTEWFYKNEFVSRKLIRWLNGNK
ncbi:MAG: AAA family ATPase [Bacteroidota bacterium]|nr:AAA family ATPase [Bacteroidota bacterium]